MNGRIVAVLAQSGGNKRKTRQKTKPTRRDKPNWGGSYVLKLLNAVLSPVCCEVPNPKMKLHCSRPRTKWSVWRIKIAGNWKPESHLD